MKKLLFIFMSIFTSYAFAWGINQNGLAIQTADRDNEVAAVLVYNDDAYYISFADATNLTLGADCEESDTIRDVNGQPVKFHIRCEMNVFWYYPETADGLSFIMNEFEHKNSVKVGSSVFSAIGFSAAQEKLKQRNEWEKKAL
ncbi:TPA: hypothetical protein ACVU4X_003296 [Vibrio parahaemolyticus]